MNSSANTTPVAPEGFDLFIYRVKKKFTGPDPYLTVAGVFLWLFTYWVLCEGLEIWRFTKLPGPVAISKDWFSTTPFQGISIFTAEYYEHIYVSCQRILIAFGIATGHTDPERGLPALAQRRHRGRVHLVRHQAGKLPDNPLIGDPKGCPRASSKILVA